MLGDDGLERSFFAERGCEFGTKNIQVRFAPRFIQFFRFDQAAKLADLFRDAAGTLSYGFKFESELSSLSAERLDLNIGIRDFGIEPAAFPIDPGQPLFSLGKLVAQARSRRNDVEYHDARFF